MYHEQGVQSVARKAKEVQTKLFTDTFHALQPDVDCLELPRSQIYSRETFPGSPQGPLCNHDLLIKNVQIKRIISLPNNLAAKGEE